MTDRRELIDQALRGVEAWEARWGAMPGAAALTSDVDLTALLDAYAARMDATLPFFHPRYAGQMLKPPHPVAAAAYAGGDVGEPEQPRARRRPGDRARWSRRSVERSPRCSGCEPHLGHLTVERDDRQPRGAVGRARAASGHGASPRGGALHARAHVPGPRRAGRARCAATPDGRMDLDALARGCARGGVGTVVAHRRDDRRRRRRPHRRGARPERAPRRAPPRRRRLRRLLRAARRRARRPPLRGDRAARLGRRRPAQARPAALRLRRRAVRATRASGGFYAHDSPYTYFTSDELHLGEISLECSRAGAAAGRPVADAAGAAAQAASARRAAPARGAPGLAARLRALRPPAPAPRARARHRRLLPAAPASEIDAASAAMLQRRHGRPRRPGLPQHAAGLDPRRVRARCTPTSSATRTRVRVLRSVLMKPEHEAWGRRAARAPRGARGPAPRSGAGSPV